MKIVLSNKITGITSIIVLLLVSTIISFHYTEVFADTSFFDDFSDIPLNWQQSGTRITVNNVTDVVNWNAKANDTSPQSISHDLGAGVISNTEWTLRGKFTVDHQTFQSQNTAQMFVGLFAEDHTKKADLTTAGWHGIYLVYSMDGASPFRAAGLAGADGSQITLGSPLTFSLFNQSTADTAGIISVGTHYFEINRTSTTTAEASIYTDNSFTNPIETITLSLPTGLTEDLRYVMIKAWDNAPVKNGAWNGTIDNIQFFTPVTNSTITNPPVNGTTTSPPINGIPISGLVGEWKFEDNALDTSGNDNDGTLSGATFVDGIIGRALSFDGTNDIVSIPNDPTLNFGTSSFSVSTWVKTTDDGGWLVNHRRNNDGDYRGWSTSIDANLAGGRMLDGARTLDGFRHDVFTRSTTEINDNVYHHLTYVVDRTTQTAMMYVDCTLQSTSDTSSIGNIDQNTIGVNIGYTGSPDTPNYPYNGILDQIRVYNRALSQYEVESLFQESGNTCPSTLSNGLPVNSTTTNLVTNSTTTNPPVNGTTTNLVTNSTTTNPPVNGTTTSPPINGIPISGLVGEWKFEDNALDTSGNDNDGTLSGATFVDGVVGRAVSFDGIDDIVDVANDPTLNFGTGSLSVSAWIKTPGDDAWLVTHNRNNDGDYRGWSIFTGDSGIVGGVVRDGSANSVDTISTTTVFDNQFHHIVYVVDRSSQTSKLYVDCTLEDTSDVSSVGNIEQNTMGVDIGGTNSPNTAVDFHTGIMDQIRVYNRTLSQSEVNTLFHESGTECPPTLSDVLPVNGTTNLPATDCTTNSTATNSTIFFNDYSSNVGWSQVGTLITIDDPMFPDIVKFNQVPGGMGVNDQRIFKKLPTTLPADGWIAEFDYKFSSSSIPSSFPFVLTTTSTNLASQSESNRVLVLHGGGGIDQLRLGGSGAPTPTGIPIVPNMQYFVRVEKTPTELVLSVFSDPARTVQVIGSPFVQNITAADFTNLNYIQHSASFVSGSARLITSEIDNTRIFTKFPENQDSSCPISTGNDTSTTNSTTTSPVTNSTTTSPVTNSTTTSPVTNSTTTNPPPISTPDPSSTYVILVASNSSVPGCQQNNECYFPSEIRIKIGDIIKWFNSDSVAHTITSGNPADGHDGEFGHSLWMTADTYSHEFTTEGQFNYYCTIHPWMTGTVLVGDVDYEPLSPWDGVSGLDNNSTTDPEPVAMPEPVPEYDYSQPPITVFTDRSSYSEGNPIKISGEVKDRLRGFPVILEVISANNTRATLEEVEVDKYQKYSITLNDTEGPSWQSSGTYTVKVLYGTEFRTAETSFQFSSYYVPTEPTQKILATMNIDLITDKVLVYGNVNLNATIQENGPSIQYIESDGTTGIVTSLSDSFEWNGTDYKTFFWISNFTKIPDDILFKLWSGNGTKGKVLVYDIATITSNNTVPASDYIESAVAENYTYINSSDSDSCINCYINPVIKNTTTSIGISNTNSTEDELDQEIILSDITETEKVSEDDTESVDVDNLKVITPSQITIPYSALELEQFQLPTQDNQTDQNVVFWSDKSVYEDGEKIHIEGIIPQTIKRSNMLIEVYSPSDFNIVNEPLSISDIGMFKIEFDTLNYLWFENGEYVIKLVNSDGEKSQLMIKVIGPTLSNTLTHPIPAEIEVNSTDNDNKPIELFENNNTLQIENSTSNEPIVYLNQVLEIIQDFVGNIFS